MSELSDNLTKQEKALRDKFVEQYLIDYEPISAVIRLGYQEAFAQQYAKQFMTESYTLKKIAEREADLGIDKEEERHRKRIVAGLYREAHSRFNSGSARVAALTQLAKIVGIEAPMKTQQVLPKVGTTDLSKLSDEELEQIEQLMSKANAAS